MVLEEVSEVGWDYVVPSIHGDNLGKCLLDSVRRLVRDLAKELERLPAA
jgi:hypothetical protein